MSALLSRVAEDLYCAARYLERAEATARIVREYTNLIVDLPTSVMSAWAPLLAITGVEVLTDIPTDEMTIIELLVSAPDSPSSILSCVERARENLRSCREVIPTDAWFVVNDLHLFVSSNAGDGLARRSRTRFLDRVIAEHQRLVGILAGAMLRDQDLVVMRERQAKLAEHLPAPRRTKVRLPMGVGASGQQVARELHDRAA